MSQVIKVMIVDDQPVVRQGLSTFLLSFDDLGLIAEAKDGYHAINLCETVTPDVILMDLVMPELDGIETTKALLQRNPDYRIVILTSFKEEEMVASAINAGASGYLLKNATADELAEAIRTAANGLPILAPEATKALMNQARHLRENQNDLTEREIEILKLISKGYSNPEIGRELFISPSTAKFHVSNILAKLNVSSRAEAITVSVKRGFISLDEI